MVTIGSGAERNMSSYKLSRYACYLIVQNADPSKEVVALGQTYFAIQTRRQEIQQMEEYSNLTTEEEKRVFLREEMKKHNTSLAATTEKAGGTIRNRLCYISKSRLSRFVWRFDCKRYTYKEKIKEKSTYIRPYGKYRIGC